MVEVEKGEILRITKHGDLHGDLTYAFVHTTTAPRQAEALGALGVQYAAESPGLLH